MHTGQGMVCNGVQRGPVVRIAQISLRNARHVYDVDTDCGTIEVAADTGTEAGRVVEECGFVLRAVHFVH